MIQIGRLYLMGDKVGTFVSYSSCWVTWISRLYFTGNKVGAYVSNSGGRATLASLSEPKPALFASSTVVLGRASWLGKKIHTFSSAPSKPRHLEQ